MNDEAMKNSEQDTPMLRLSPIPNVERPIPHLSSFILHRSSFIPEP